MIDNQLNTNKISTLEWDLSPNPSFILILAHGAGTTMNQPFLKKLSTAISTKGHVLRYNFPYILEGRKSPGSPKSAIEQVGKMVGLAKHDFQNLPIFLSGKSYGGRMSSHWSAVNHDPIVKGLIYYGFPLHPAGKEGVERAKHLPEIQVPQLFIQGTNDALANLDLLQQCLKPLKNTTLSILEGADHSFKISKKFGKSEKEILDELVKISLDWIDARL